MPLNDTIKTIVPAVTDFQQYGQMKPDMVLVPQWVKPVDITDISLIGLDGVLHPSLPVNEKWVFISFLVLFFMMAFSFLRSSGWLTDSFSSFFNVKDRISIFSKSTVTDFESRFILFLFSIGVFSLYSYLVLTPTAETFLFITFLKFIGVTMVFFLAKYILIKITAYVFLQPTLQKIATDSYYNIVTYLGVVLFPLLFFQVYFPENLQNSVGVISLMLCIIAFLFFTIKLFLILFYKIATTFYILLYLCTLEIIPLMFMFKVYNIVIQGV
ncbi:MAG: DUF4271 domain-containing protein [Paludibacter sp.]|nr:DUF4271 domain-containing protein [Paludibacter sp.]